MSLDQRQGALMEADEKCFDIQWHLLEVSYELVASQTQPHQSIGIIESDFSDGGTARVRQVGVTVVDGQSAETCQKVQRSKFTFIYTDNYCKLTLCEIASVINCLNYSSMRL